jgi:hypothetical protein
MENKFQCENRHHVPGKGWKRCTYYAAYEIFALTEKGKTYLHLCEKHHDQFVESGKTIYIDNPFQSLDICPECGSKIDFSTSLPICSGDHPISGKTHRFLTERYPSLFQKAQIPEVNGERICQGEVSKS